MYDERVNQINAQIQHLTGLKRQLRVREKDLDARARYLSTPGTIKSNSVKTMRGNLMASLPAYMMPGNVGGINEVTWPFYFQVNIDLGDDPTISSNLYTNQSFQVDQEACFMLQSISIAYDTNGAGASAISNAPLQVEIIDRQSSRRFNDGPMPIQMIGTDSCPSILPVPMYVHPNGIIDFKINGFSTVDLATEGSGSFQISLFGNRMRIEDGGKVLSTIFASDYR